MSSVHVQCHKIDLVMVVVVVVVVVVFIPLSVGLHLFSLDFC
jgi:hypothetical protein